MNDTIRLTKFQKRLYQRMVTAFRSFDKKIPMEKGEDLKEVKKIWHLISLCEVDLFYVNFEKIQVVRNLVSSMIAVEYFYSRSETLYRAESIRLKREEILSAFHGEGEIEKTEFVHDYLAENVRYDFAAAKNHTRSRSFQIEGALLDNLAVCSGIAKAARYLLEGLGVNSLVISGEGLAESNELVGIDSAHAWNLNLLSDGCYHMDVTWDLKEASPLQTVLHQYCNLDDDTMVLNHDWDYLQYPRAQNLSANYYYRRGIYFRSRQVLERYAKKCFQQRLSVITFRLDACAGFPDDGGHMVINNLMNLASKCVGGAQIKVNYLYDSNTLVATLLIQYA